MKRTYQPNTRKRAKCHGFRARMSTKGGRAVLARRRAKGRKRLTVQLQNVNTIKSSADITYLFENGRRIGTPDFSFIIARTAEQHDQNGRVAFIAGKKNGNAVWRNKAKRRMRALYRDLDMDFPGYDMVLMARKQINEMRYVDLKEDLSQAKHKMHCL